MAPRPFWKGYLKLSLVTCPVVVEPARTDRETVRFHTVNRRTGNRVESRYVDAETGRPVADDDQVHGYETEPDQYVMIEDEELDEVGLESTRTIDIEKFVDRAKVKWIWLDRPHFLKPGDEVGEEAFAVIRDALEDTGTAAVSRLVLYRREHPVLLVPRGKGMLLWTLRYGDEVRPADDYVPEDQPKPDAKLTRLVAKVIEARTAAWKPEFVKDRMQARLKEIIAGKEAKGKPAHGKSAPVRETEGNVVSIMDALKKSLEGDKKAGAKKG